MTKAAAFLSIVFLAGCAGTGPYYKYYWKKDGTSYEQAVSAQASCQYEVSMAKLPTASERQQTMEACMKKDGFRWGTYVVQ